jgi:hypothetical protein
MNSLKIRALVAIAVAFAAGCSDHPGRAQQSSPSTPTTTTALASPDAPPGPEFEDATRIHCGPQASTDEAEYDLIVRGDGSAFFYNGDRGSNAGNGYQPSGTGLVNFSIYKNPRLWSKAAHIDE